MNKNHKRIVLVGKAASGKDFARKKLQRRGYKYGVSYTSRPPRTNEVDGTDYYFLTQEDFEQKIKENFFYEQVSFNGWYYGTSMEQFYNDDVFIMTPHGISLISQEDRENTFIIFINIPLDIRKQRLMLRNDADRVERRIDADEKDFHAFKNYDMCITNEEF